VHNPDPDIGPLPEPRRQVGDDEVEDLLEVGQGSPIPANIPEQDVEMSRETRGQTVDEAAARPAAGPALNSDGTPVNIPDCPVCHQMVLCLGNEWRCMDSPMCPWFWRVGMPPYWETDAAVTPDEPMIIDAQMPSSIEPGSLAEHAWASVFGEDAPSEMDGAFIRIA
jgi:hypothetical protein